MKRIFFLSFFLSFSTYAQNLATTTEDFDTFEWSESFRRSVIADVKTFLNQTVNWEHIDSRKSRIKIEAYRVEAIGKGYNRADFQLSAILASNCTNDSGDPYYMYFVNENKYGFNSMVLSLDYKANEAVTSLFRLAENDFIPSVFIKNGKKNDFVELQRDSALTIRKILFKEYTRHKTYKWASTKTLNTFAAKAKTIGYKQAESGSAGKTTQGKVDAVSYGTGNININATSICDADLGRLFK